MGSRVTRGRTGSWVASRLGEKRRGRERAGWLRWLGWRAGKALAGLREAQGGLLRWLLLLLHFYFFKTEMETEKLREKGEELELKENILQLLELSTILINYIGHF